MDFILSGFKTIIMGGAKTYEFLSSNIQVGSLSVTPFGIFTISFLLIILGWTIAKFLFGGWL